MKVVKDILISYVTNYLAISYEHDIPFEYYYLNREHPECTLYDMSDSEIAHKYPFSGERLILDCWSLVEEYEKVNEEDWEQFIHTINDIVTRASEAIKK